MMNFLNQVQLSAQINNMSVLNPSSPAITVFNGGLYLFWIDAKSASIAYSVWTATTGETGGWSSVTNLSSCGVGVASGTGPSCAVFGTNLYVFYNGNGNNGTFYAVFDGTKWTPAAIPSGGNFLPNTSPSAAAFNNQLCVFWNGSGADGIWFSSFDGTKWSSQSNLANLVPGLGIANGTGPSVCTYDNDLYVFYNGNGNNGTFYTTFDGNTWISPVSIAPLVGGMGFAPGTSPAACVVQNGAALALFWCGSGPGGMYFTTVDATGWAPKQGLILPTIQPGILGKTTPAMTVFNLQPIVCWNGLGNDGIWLTSLVNFTLSAYTYAPIIDAMYNAYDFQVLMDDQTTINTLMDLVPSMTAGQQVLLNSNTTQNQPPATQNPPIPPGLFNFNVLSSNQITYLLTLCVGLLGFALYRYNRVNIVLLGGRLLVMEFINNNNNQLPAQIPLLPVLRANNEL